MVIDKQALKIALKKEAQALGFAAEATFDQIIAVHLQDEGPA